MPTVKVNLPTLHSAQRAIRSATSRFVVVAAGRRFGKTMLCACLCSIVASKAGRVWWIAPSYMQAQIGWRAIVAVVGQIPYVEVLRGAMIVKFPDGGFIQVRSADAEGGNRGEGLDFLVVDEAAHIRKLADMWQQELRPALSDRLGKAIFISTPRGFNDFYELWKRQDSDADWRSFQFPTSANPRISRGEIEKARAELPALVFRQEYLAEFVQLAGAMFRREWFGLLDSAPAVRAVARGWDLAASTKSSADYTVGAKVGFTPDGGIIILDVVRGRWEWPEALRVIAQTARMDGPLVSQVVEDNGQQKAALQLIRREQALAGYPFYGLTEILNAPMPDKVTRANTWLARAEQGYVGIMRANWNSEFLDVLCSFPEGSHDDDVDAVSAAVMAIGEPQQVRQVIYAPVRIGADF